MKYSFTRSYVCFPSSLRHVFRGRWDFLEPIPAVFVPGPGLAPWISRHIVAGPHSKTDDNSHLPPRANLEFLISLTCMCLDRGNKPERLETTCGLHAERPRDRTRCFLVVRRQCYDCILFHELDWSSSLSGGWIPVGTSNKVEPANFGSRSPTFADIHPQCSPTSRGKF